MDKNFRFGGEFPHSLDDKGRLTLPGKLRENLQISEKPDELRAIANKDGYITLYPYEQWLKVEDRIQAIANPASRTVAIREIISKSEWLNVDKAGRVLLIPNHRDVAGLNRDVTVLGGLLKIEVWDRARREAQHIIDEAALLDVIQTEEIPL